MSAFHPLRSYSGRPATDPMRLSGDSVLGPLNTFSSDITGLGIPLADWST